VRFYINLAAAATDIVASDWCCWCSSEYLDDLIVANNLVNRLLIFHHSFQSKSLALIYCWYSIHLGFLLLHRNSCLVLHQGATDVQHIHIFSLNCISHSRTESISIVSKSLKSSYSSVSELVTLNVAKPREASRPPNAE